MTLKQVNQFHTSDPKLLDRELNTLEDNVAKETESIRSTFLPAPTCLTYTYSTSPGIVHAQADTQLSVDTSMGNVTVVLPALSPKNFGRRFVILKRVTANTITIVCQDPAVTLNGGSPVNVSLASGGATFLCDAVGYYR